jgi:RNA polymerase sigma-70 factor (ECF subfamily)
VSGLDRWDDRRLIEQSQQGDPAAFAELYRRYYRRLYHTLHRLLRNREDAEDVLQSTFLNAWRSIGCFKGESELFTWLYRIAINLAISHHRRRLSNREKSLGEWNEEQPVYDPPAMVPHPSTGLETQEALERLWHALQRLSEDHRIIICLKDIEEMSYEDIAQTLAIPIGTVRSRLHRARAELAELLGVTPKPPAAILTPQNRTPSAHAPTDGIGHPD